MDDSIRQEGTPQPAAERKEDNEGSTIASAKTYRAPDVKWLGMTATDIKSRERTMNEKRRKAERNAFVAQKEREERWRGGVGQSGANKELGNKGHSAAERNRRHS